MNKAGLLVGVAILVAGSYLVDRFDRPTYVEPLGVKKAVVVGATSGIGRQLAKVLAHNGYTVGLVGRKQHLLTSLQKEIADKTYVKQIDLSKPDARERLEHLIYEMGGIDLMVVSVTALSDVDCLKTRKTLSLDALRTFVDVDVRGFWVAASLAAAYFEKQKHGHIVGVSSIDAEKGTPPLPEYGAAKRFVRHYLDGLRHWFIQQRIPVCVTEIIPGPVDVERQTYSDIPGLFWSTTSQVAAQQIYEAIRDKKDYAYVTKRWELIAWILWCMPGWLYRRVR